MLFLFSCTLAFRCPHAAAFYLGHTEQSDGSSCRLTGLDVRRCAHLNCIWIFWRCGLVWEHCRYHRVLRSTRTTILISLSCQIEASQLPSALPFFSLNAEADKPSSCFHSSAITLSYFWFSLLMMQLLTDYLH